LKQSTVDRDELAAASILLCGCTSLRDSQRPLAFCTDKHQKLVTEALTGALGRRTILSINGSRKL
jgi:hypothetical protein